MITKRRIILFLAFTILALAFQSSVEAKTQTGTIITQSGKRYQDVEYKVDNRYKIIVIQFEDHKKNVSFSVIDAILDEDGEDITSKILGEYVEPAKKDSPSIDLEHEQPAALQPESETPKKAGIWRSENDPVRREARKKPWSATVGINGGYFQPTGSWYDGVNGGIGFEGVFRVAVTTSLAIRLSVTNTGMEYEESLSQFYDFQVMHYCAGIEFYHNPNEAQGDEVYFNWYVYSQVGVANHQETAKATMTDELGNVISREGETTSISRLMLTFGAGVIPMLSPSVGLSIGGELGVIHIESVEGGYLGTWDDSIVYAHNLGVKAGLVVFIK